MFLLKISQNVQHLMTVLSDAIFNFLAQIVCVRVVKIVVSKSLSYFLSELYNRVNFSIYLCGACTT